MVEYIRNEKNPKMRLNNDETDFVDTQILSFTQFELVAILGNYLYSLRTLNLLMKFFYTFLYIN